MKAQPKSNSYLKLKKKWIEMYEDTTDRDDLDWESVCVGWCRAHGLSVREGIKFYNRMIKTGYY